MQFQTLGERRKSSDWRLYLIRADTVRIVSSGFSFAWNRVPILVVRAHVRFQTLRTSGPIKLRSKALPLIRGDLPVRMAFEEATDA